MINKVPSILSRLTALALFTAPLCLPAVHGQEVYSQVVGAIALDVPRQSDVVVAFPFKRSASLRGQVATVDGTAVTIADADMTASEFAAVGDVPAFYLYVESGELEGRRFDIATNTATTITVASGSLTGLGTAQVSIREHWTLGKAFPDGVGEAEVEPGLRNIELIVPDTVSIGGGLAANRIFYFYNDAWREVGKALSVSVDAAAIAPGTAFVIRNNGYDDVRSYFFGEVVSAPLAIPLVSAATETVDNFVSVERPLGLTLNDLQLHSSGVFAASTGTDEGTRGDVLLVYPANAGKNVTPTEYFYYNSGWRKVGGDGSDVGAIDKIEAGQGVAVRKKAGSDATTYWVNDWSLGQ